MWEAGLAKNWAISGISDQTREAVTAAAEAAGMPIGAWVEKALGKALTEGLEAGVWIEAIETRVRAVVAQELQPVQYVLVHVEAAGSSASNVLALDLARALMRRRRDG